MQHVVKPGDTLSHLALRYYGNGVKWKPIWYANRKVIEDAQKRFTTTRFRPTGPNWIFPGATLVIPDITEKEGR